MRTSFFDSHSGNRATGHPAEFDESEMLTGLQGCRADSSRDKHALLPALRCATRRTKRVKNGIGERSLGTK